MDLTHEIVTTPFIISLFMSGVYALWINSIAFYIYLGWYVIFFMVAEIIYYLAFMKKTFFNIVIIVHHIITIIVAYIGVQYEGNLMIQTVCILVEFNTSVLKIKHLIGKDHFLYAYLDKIFIWSWVLLRLIMYPIVIAIQNYVMIMCEYTPIHYYITNFCQISLMMFYLLWSYSLFAK
jgi:hypothetical protein